MRDEMTERFYPDPITLNAFIEHMKSNTTAFMANMVSLKNINPRTIEEWYKVWLAWNEVFFKE